MSAIVCPHCHKVLRPLPGWSPDDLLSCDSCNIAFRVPAAPTNRPHDASRATDWLQVEQTPFPTSRRSPNRQDSTPDADLPEILPVLADEPSGGVSPRRNRPRVDPAVLTTGGVLLVCFMFAMISVSLASNLLAGREADPARGGGIATWIPFVFYFLVGFVVAGLTSRDRLWQVFYLALVTPILGFSLSAIIFLPYAPFLFDSTPVGAALRSFVQDAVPGVALTNVLNGILVIGGGVGHRLLAWMAPSPRRWNYPLPGSTTVPVADPQRSGLLIGVYRVLAYLFLLASLPLCCFLIPLFCGTVVFRALTQLANRKSIQSARSVLTEDDRPAIVYLRSFSDDGRHPSEGWTRRLNNGLNVLLSATLEQRLAATMQRYGPFVAIGKPGEELPDTGAARLYVADANWQTVVQNLLSENGATVVFQAGSTQGLRWELKTIAERVPPEQVILFFPFSLDASAAQADEQYACFLDWAASCLPRAKLPAKLNRGVAFLAFDEWWRALPLSPSQEVPSRHPLRHVLRELQQSRDFRFRPSFRLARDWWKLLVLMILGGVLGWTVWLNHSIVKRSHELGQPILPIPRPRVDGP